MIKTNLIDSYREINNYGGYTWGRDNPDYVRSRLDLILTTKKLKNSIINSNVYLAPHESDHRMVITEYSI